MEIINYHTLEAFDCQAFNRIHPFPFSTLDGLLTPDAFSELLSTFPSLSLFEKHSGIKRIHGQRPHNRLYLAYGHTIYRTGQKNKGIITRSDLSLSWQSFIAFILEDPRYRKFIENALGHKDFEIRLAWHVGFTGSEVSPHLDSADKVGTHIFYFNSHADWKPSWGGATLVLGNKLSPIKNPDFSDFGDSRSCEFLGNKSLLFKNTKLAWHGVRPLACPDGSYRKLFNVIIELPESRTKGIWAKFKSLARKHYLGRN